jgi:hypothetical protein
VLDRGHGNIIIRFPSYFSAAMGLLVGGIVACRRILPTNSIMVIILDLLFIVGILGFEFDNIRSIGQTAEFL